MAENRIDIIVNLIKEESERAIKEVTQAWNVLKKGLDDSGGAFKRIQGSFTELNQGLELAKKALRGVKSAFDFALGTIDQGEAVNNIAIGFERLQQSAGQDAKQALLDLGQATQGLVTDLQLMQASNQAVLLGLPTEGFNEAAEAAVKLGQAMGIDALSAIESFTTGVGRGSIQMLDNLGVIVKSQEAYQKFADANNKVVTSLTESEKKLAFQQEAYRKIISSASDLGEATNTAGKSLQQIRTTLANFTNQIAKSVINNKSFIKTFESLKKLFTELPFDSVIDLFGKVLTAISKVAKIVIELARVVNKVLKPALEILIATLDTAKEAYGFLADAAKRSFNSQGDAIKNYNNNLAKAKDAISEVNQAIIAGDFVQAKKAYLDLADAVNSNTKVADIYGGALDKLKPKIQGLKPVIKEIVEQQDKLKIKTIETSKVLDGFFAGIGENFAGLLNGEGLDFKSILGNLTGSLTELGSGIFKNVFDDVGNLIGKEELGIGDALGANLAKTLGVEGVAGKALAGAASAGAGIYVQTLGTSILNSVKDIGKSTGDSVAGLASILFPFTGVSFLDDAIGGLFGGNKDAAANARDSFVNFINESVKNTAPDLQLIIDGELSKVDFSLAGGRDAFQGGSGGLDKEFEGVSGNIVASFSAIGEAFAQLSGNADLHGSQVAAIISDNVGGSLNNLQILLGEIGISADQVGAALEEAYLNGDLAAGEFLATSSQVEDLFTVGIPGAVVDTLQAFNNFKEGGKLSGRIAKDALQDVAAEMLELGASSTDTFEALINNLIESGANAEEVQILFDALGKNGVNSLGDLVNLTTQQTAAITNLAQNTGFAFTNTEDSVRGVREELEKIPDRKDIDIVARVRVEPQDDAARDLVSNGLLTEGI